MLNSSHINEIFCDQPVPVIHGQEFQNSVNHEHIVGAVDAGFSFWDTGRVLEHLES